MSQQTTYNSLCRWTFHSGKGGFLPANVRPQWSADKLTSAGMVRLVKDKIAPRIPEHIKLGIELHYDTEINEESASEIADAITDSGMHLAMITPGAHSHFAYGGIASLDDRERKAAEELAWRTIDVTYGPMKKTWHSDAELAPTLVLWNGSYGYDLATVAVREMYQNLKQSLADLCKYEKKCGDALYIGIEPKPNEGHPAMFLPTVSSTIVIWNKLKEEFGISLERKGVNKEIGHSEMIGLDHVLDTVEEIDNGMLVHMHLNSQGYNDGITLGGPGKFDIDHGVKINGMNIAVAGLIQDAKYKRWRGHDMQVRAYDNEDQAIDRVVRSLLSWDACEAIASKFDQKLLHGHLARRETAKAEDMMRGAVVDAQKYFDEVYKA